MTDWIDTLADTLFHAVEFVSQGRTPRQILGIVATAISLFLGIAIVVLIFFRQELPAGGWPAIGILIILSIAIAVYGFLAPRRM